jgi:signal transduction histidine kinase
MIQGTETPRALTSEAFQNAAGPITFRNRTLALFAIPSFSIVMLSNPARLGGSLIEWFLIGCLAYVVTVLVLLCFRATVLPQTNRKPNWWLTVVAFFVAGALRGLAVWSVGRAWGIIPDSDLLFRMTSGFLLVLGGMSTLAIYEASRIKQEEQLAALQLQTTRLDELRGGIRERIRISQEELVEKVRGILQPIVAQLRTDLKSADAKSAVNTIQNAVDQLVRPLSREMGSAGSDFEKSIVEGARATSARRLKETWPKRVQASSMMVPALAVFATMTTAPGPLALYVPAAAFLAFLTVTVLVFAVFQFTRAVTAGLWWPVWAAFLISVAPAALAPLLAKTVLDALGWVTPSANWFQFGLVLASTVVIAFLMQLVRTQRAGHEQKLRNVVRDLSVLNSQLRQEVWFDRRRTAAVLHGPIQASLYASAMRINPAEKLSPEMVEAVERDIATALAKLDGSNMIEPFESVMAQIQEVWEGVAEVRLEAIPVELKHVFENNPTASSCSLEIIREAVSNAVKHGKASIIEVSIRLTGESFLSIEVRNNGKMVPDDKRAGYGSEILDEVAFEWSLDNLPAGVILKALVAIQK